MGNLLSYSGITTKIRAMKRHLITDSQFCEMAALESVTEAVEYLRRLPAYSQVFTDLESLELHRGAIEQRLFLSVYQDFAKLYRFSSLSQRKFLDLYFMRYEISILKRCFRNAVGRHPLDIDLSAFQAFFNGHSSLDLGKLASCKDLQELTENLQGSVYYKLLNHLESQNQTSLFDREIHLDLLYFKSTWKTFGKHLSKKEKELLARCFGSRLDLLNIQWIYRSGKYYHLNPADIYALLIPVYYRLTKEQIEKLAGSSSSEEFYSVLKTTRYGKIEDLDTMKIPDLEHLTQLILDRIYRSSAQRHPYSIACVNSYLYFKEEEIQKIITLIEGIRYRLSADEIISYVLKTGKEVASS